MINLQPYWLGKMSQSFKSCFYDINWVILKIFTDLSKTCLAIYTLVLFDNKGYIIIWILLKQGLVLSTWCAYLTAYSCERVPPNWSSLQGGHPSLMLRLRLKILKLLWYTRKWIICRLLKIPVLAKMVINWNDVYLNRWTWLYMWHFLWNCF